MTTAPPLTGRTALITGEASGLGRAIAVRLADDGAAVAVNHLPDDWSASAAREVVTEIEARGGRWPSGRTSPTRMQCRQ